MRALSKTPPAPPPRSGLGAPVPDTRTGFQEPHDPDFLGRLLDRAAAARRARGEPEPLGIGFALLLGGAASLAFWAALAWWWFG